jgi:hypothetical protein
LDLPAFNLTLAREMDGSLIAPCAACFNQMKGTDHILESDYLTGLIGLAFVLLESRKWWSKHLIDPRPVLCTVGLAD